MKRKIISIVLCIAICMSACAMLFSCGKGKTPDALVIMTDDLDGLFNPFYSTTGADSTIVSMTQIGMLTTGYENGEVVVSCGDSEPVVVKDYAVIYDEATNTTAYTFVIKNGIKYSDGTPLTIEDVLFNLYVYLDPVYTGSSTMYSTDILGLQAYRLQLESSDSTGQDDLLTQGATNRANNRINELINLFKAVGATMTEGSYEAGYNKMIEAIASHRLSTGYKEAISTNPDLVTNAQLRQDYERTLELFRKELENDYVSAIESYLEDPYKSTGEFDEITSFMYAEGFVTLEYNLGADGKEDKSSIKKVTRDYPATVNSKAAAIDYVYNQKIEQELHMILQYWGTAQTLETEYMAKAKEVILKENMVDGELAIKNISGIESLGHTTEETSVTVKGGTYNIAHEHNEDGTPVNADEYDVLRITINGVDPKAIWNFAFSVAPQHYYAPGYEVDIENNKFGVEYASFDFHKNVLQSVRNVKVPMGAGAYMATDANNNNNPEGTAFFANNVVYFKANNNFLLGQPKIEKVRYQVVSSSNALNALQTGSVHFVTPQFTQNNIDKINSMAKDGIKSMYTDQLGYGYIGINAGKVASIHLRRAIMSAMDTSLAMMYYSTGTAERIFWPMSTVSWAYPKDELGNPSRDNEKSYPAVNFNREDAKEAIEDYMALAGVSAGDSDLTMKFTIAGANLTDHPAYETFRAAADLLNECGWDVEVVPDTQALTKLSTGSLTVWAAAWGSTIDPDMYQVYHKNSTATSTLAWGYREILNDDITYAEEQDILDALSELIDKARETEDQDVRAEHYEKAMKLVLDLAVELPVYQRSVLYAYNSNVIKESSLPSVLNPYTSPLDHLWEIEFAD